MTSRVPFFCALLALGALARAAETTAVEVTFRLVVVPDAEYAADPEAFDRAIRQPAVAKRIAPYAESLPRVAVKLGQKATVHVIRELRYPATFETGADGQTVPATFESASLGPAISVVPEWIDGKICVHGEIELVGFDGFTPGDDAAQTPSFTTKSAPYRCAMENGGTFGFWLPGFWMDSKTVSGSFVERITAKPDKKPEGELVPKRIGVLVTTKLFTLPPRLPANARLEVDVFNVTGTRLADEAMSRVRKWQGAADPDSRVLAFVDDKDSMPEGATKIPVSEPKPGEFEFAIAQGWRGTVTWRTASNSLELGFFAPPDNGRSIRTNVDPSTLVTGPCRALLVRADGGEAVLVLIRKKE